MCAVHNGAELLNRLFDLFDSAEDPPEREPIYEDLEIDECHDFFRGKWRDLDPGEVAQYGHCSSWLYSRQYHYYLPALLRAAILFPNAEVATWQIYRISHDPDGLSGRLTWAQRDFICDVIHFVASHETFMDEAFVQAFSNLYALPLLPDAVDEPT